MNNELKIELVRKFGAALVDCIYDTIQEEHREQMASFSREEQKEIIRLSFFGASKAILKTMS